MLSLKLLFICAALSLGAAPFDPAPPVDDRGFEALRPCDRCNCRELELRFERSQETIVRLSEEVDALRREVAELKRKTKAEPARTPRVYGPGVKWEPNTRYEKAADGLLYYYDKEPRAPKFRLVPVLLEP